MRLFLRLLTLLALMGAPLAAPAAAMAAAPVTSECHSLPMADHEMPKGEHGQAAPCCIAVPPAIDPPVAMLGAVDGPEHLAFVAVIEPFRLGAGPHAEDPPPRFA